MKPILSFTVVVILLSFHCAPAYGQWSADPAVNTPVCRALYDQVRPVAISDGAGGIIISWEDTRDIPGIYAQHLSAAGAARWDTGGAAICTAGMSESFPGIVGDGAGGAIVAWQEVNRNSTGFWDIYAGRITASGSLSWNVLGTAVSTTLFDKYYPHLVSDTANGAIIVWQQTPTGGTADVYAQRLGSNGSLLWPDTGVAVCAVDGDQYAAAAVTDKRGGAIVAWIDNRVAGSGIYAQRINPAGNLMWDLAGVALCLSGHVEGTAIGMTSDDSGGAIVTWQDYRNGNRDIYIQKIDSSGHVRWTTDGVLLNQAGDNTDVEAPGIICDRSGGAVIAWPEIRTGNAWNVYAQRVNAAGIVQWTANGVKVCTDSGDQREPVLNNDGAGNYIVAWSDYRIGLHYALYAQKISGTGSTVWENNGVPISTAEGDKTKIVIVPDEALGAVIGWQDGRVSNVANDIYVQEVDRFGRLGGNTTTIFLNSHWNLISLPRILRENGKTVLFPNATSHAFSYEGSYVIHDSLKMGLGYWLEFSAPDSLVMSGIPVIVDTIPVRAGWNMVGAISTPMPAANVTSVPLGITTSPFFRYNGAYLVSATLLPTFGYWVNVSQAGILIMDNSPSANKSGRIRIVDGNELPPSPPGRDPQSGRQTPERPLVYALAQNFPNPFNPSTSIGFEIKERGAVSLKVYNVLGQEVATLIDGVKEAGSYSVRFDAAHQPSGVYFYRLQAGLFTSSREMLILK